MEGKSYYERVAETMLPHVRGRPVHMQRFPDGIEGDACSLREPSRRLAELRG